MSFETLGLSAALLRAIDAQGYTTPTPIQNKAIPLILQGKDVMAAAQTGTGKTAGFTLPMLQRLHGEGKHSKRRHVRALVLTPTRELAAQVGDSIEQYGNNLPLRSAVIFGGVNIKPQIEQLRRGVDIVVATPGRLLDHVGQNTLDLSKIDILVLDEADRMLDMGFIHDIRKILVLLPDNTQRQSLLFSATFSKEIKQLANRLLRKPALVEVARRNAAAEGIEQAAYQVEKPRKRALLSQLIRTHDWYQVLVFTRTKHGANRLAKQLDTDGLSTAAIHGNKSQAARTRALEGFKQGKIQVLVATDIAARGLDIDQLPQVVNYELPNVPEDYVHRIGRTGRAGQLGRAISLVSQEERKLLTDIERLIKKSIRVLETPKINAAPAKPKPAPAQSGPKHQGDTRKVKNGKGGNRRGAKANSEGNPVGKASNRKRSNRAKLSTGSAPSKTPLENKFASRKPERRQAADGNVHAPQRGRGLAKQERPALFGR